MSANDVATRDASTLDRLLAEAKVVVVVGPGGVGKTTLAAAMAARAAIEHGRRALVVTVDPARRLADALGVGESGAGGVAEVPMSVPLGPTADHDGGAGAMWAVMVDMEQSWDRLVRRHAPDNATRDGLLDNELYQTLTTRFVQSHDYIALDRLVDLADQDDYDLVVIDTPPSVHALDVLDAPDRMLEFFGSRLLTWLTAPYRTRMVRVAAKPFLVVAERLLGGPFLEQIAEFFWLFSSLQPGFARRARAVKRRLSDPDTRYVVVQTPEAVPRARGTELAAELRRRGHPPALTIVNRTLDPSVRALDDAAIDAIGHRTLRDAVRTLRDTAEADAAAPAAIGPTHQVLWTAGSLVDASDLSALFG
ncbi:MAG: ArsA-related P-loop ATPase [Acidimicrobiales bacterium]